MNRATLHGPNRRVLDSVRPDQDCVKERKRRRGLSTGTTSHKQQRKSRIIDYILWAPQNHRHQFIIIIIVSTATTNRKRCDVYVQPCTLGILMNCAGWKTARWDNIFGSLADLILSRLNQVDDSRLNTGEPMWQRQSLDLRTHSPGDCSSSVYP